MRRFVLLAVLCTLSLPISMSLSGCYLKDNGQNFCSGYQTGPSSSATSSITLQPNTYGLSVNFGATNEVVSAKAFTCKGIPSGLHTFTYGSSDMTLVDVSPSGQICGGTWNRNSGNSVPNFTTCIPTNKTGVAYLTASGGGATSNPVPAFVHPQVTSVVLGTTPHSCSTNPANGQPSPVTICTTTNPNTPAGCTPAYTQTTCISQNNTVPLAATVYADVNGVPTDITCAAGHLTYTPQSTAIVTVDQNGIATAHLPGATVINANIAQASSTAGYFFTCPPASISLSVPGATSPQQGTPADPISVNQTTTQPLTTTVLDTQNNPITGLTLTYTSTDPINISVNGNGLVSSLFPSTANIVAQCLPGVCNPAPQDQIGLFGAGMPVTSNPVAVTTPGPSSDVLYAASPLSYGYEPIDFINGTVTLPVKLPYLPNSMVLNQKGTYLYFGSAAELMITNALTNALTVQAPNVPGTVLTVSPDGNTVVIHDPCRQLFYLYSQTNNTSLQFPAPGPTVACDANNEPIVVNNGAANPFYSSAVPGGEVNPPYAAQFTEDNQTLYITYSNPPSANTPNAATLFVYSHFTGWHACTDNGANPATNCPASSSGANASAIPSVAVTVPAVGVYASSTTATQASAFSYCATGPNNVATANNTENPNTAVNPSNYYPPVGIVTDPIDQVAATTDGKHILGATAATASLTDIDVTIPAGACPTTGNLLFGPAGNPAGTPYTTALGVANIANIHQIVPSPSSALAFVTFYSTTPGTSNNTLLPAYQIPAAGGGVITPVTLTGAAPGAPIAGVFSPDANTFYVSTDQDNLIHFIKTTTLTDTQQLSPSLVNSANQPVPAYFLAARPRPQE